MTTTVTNVKQFIEYKTNKAGSTTATSMVSTKKVETVGCSLEPSTTKVATESDSLGPIPRPTVDRDLAPEGGAFAKAAEKMESRMSSFLTMVKQTFMTKVPDDKKTPTKPTSKKTTKTKLKEEEKHFPTPTALKKCHSLDSKKHVSRNKVKDIIENKFCPEAEKQGDMTKIQAQSQGPTSKIQKTKLNLLSIESQAATGNPVAPSAKRCMAQLLDACDGDADKNPHNWKGDGSVSIGKRKYRIDLKTTAYNPGICKIHISRVSSGSDSNIGTLLTVTDERDDGQERANELYHNELLEEWGDTLRVRRRGYTSVLRCRSRILGRGIQRGRQ